MATSTGSETANLFTTWMRRVGRSIPLNRKTRRDPPNIRASPCVLLYGGALLNGKGGGRMSNLGEKVFWIILLALVLKLLSLNI
jgi:hypothetical protein